MNALPSTEIPIRNYVHILCKRHRLILSLFFLIVTLVTLLTFLSTPVYEATAQVLVKVGRENLYTPTTLSKESAEPKFFSDGQEAQTNSEIEILKSRILAKNVINFIGIENIYPELVETKRGDMVKAREPASRQMKPIKTHLSGSESSESNSGGGAKTASPIDLAVDMFQKNLQIEGIKKTNVIQLTFLHRNREMATTTLDTVLTQNMDLHLQIHRNAKSARFFEELSQAQANELQEAQRRLADFKRENDIISSPEELLEQKLNEESELRIAVNRTLSEAAEIGGRLKKLRSQISGIPKTVTLEHEESDNPQTISLLQNRLTELEAKQTDLRSRYSDDNLLVQNNTKDLYEIRARIAEQEQTKYSRVRSGLNNIYQLRMGELLRNEASYQALKAKKAAQLQQLSAYQKIIQVLDASENEYNQLKQKVDIAKKSYNNLLVGYEESKMSGAMDIERITNLSVLDPAHSSLTPVKPKKLLNLILALFLGGIASLGMAFILEYFNKTFETPEDVESFLGLNVLASIPDFGDIKQTP